MQETITETITKVKTVQKSSQQSVIQSAQKSTFAASSKKEAVGNQKTSAQSAKKETLAVTSQLSSNVRAQSALKSVRSSVTSTAKKGNKIGRQTAMIRGDDTTAPGQYDVKGMSFGDNAKSFTIGVKRESRVEQSPGPGSYEPERSDSATKYRNPRAVNFDKVTGRKSPSRDRDNSSELTSPERFYQWPKELPIYTIGEKRDEKPREGPGPGEYNLDDSAVKPRVTGYH